MDLIIKNASLEEVTAICYRIGEPNFRELVEKERKFGVVEYLVNHDIDLEQAEKAYEQDVHNTEVQVALENNLYDEVPEAAQAIQEAEPVQVKPAQEVQQNELHLDKAPEKPNVNLEDSLHQLATKLVQAQGSKALVAILLEFGAKSLPELNKAHYEAVIERIKENL